MPITSGNLSADYWAERLAQVRKDLDASASGVHPWRDRDGVALLKYLGWLDGRWKAAGGKVRQTA